jgi:DNA-binding cell septation regulator SpoVG
MRCGKTLSLSFIAFVVVSSYLFADLRVTKISRSGTDVSVCLNDDIVISNVVLLKNNDLKLPKYHKGSRQYTQFSILKRDFKQYLIDALSNNRTSSKIKSTSFKINKFSIFIGKHETIRAFASVIFDDDIEVECRVMRGRDGLWVAWPCNKINGVWAKNLKFINRNLKKQIEQELITRYTSVVNKNVKVESN